MSLGLRRDGVEWLGLASAFLECLLRWGGVEAVGGESGGGFGRILVLVGLVSCNVETSVRGGYEGHRDEPGDEIL